MSAGALIAVVLLLALAPAAHATVAPPVPDAELIARYAVAEFADVGVRAVGRVRCRRLRRAAASCRAEVNGHGRWHMWVELKRDGAYDVTGWTL